jgi:hypothetical protein
MINMKKLWDVIQAQGIVVHSLALLKISDDYFSVTIVMQELYTFPLFYF